MTPTALKVLKQSFVDGGVVVLDGLDKHQGWGQRERTAAAWLHAEGYGLYQTSTSFDPSTFTIWSKGKKHLGILK